MTFSNTSKSGLEIPAKILCIYSKSIGQAIILSHRKYFMQPPFSVCIKITYHPAWIPYCNTIGRDRAVYNTSSPYHAVFSYGNSRQKNTAAANPDIILYLYRTCISSKKCCLTFPPIRYKPFLW